MHELSEVSALSAQIASFTNMLKLVNTSSLVVSASPMVSASPVSPVSPNRTYSSVNSISCVFCGGGHVYDDCLNNLVSVNYVENYNAGGYNIGNNLYSNTYNPGWRQHPNFSWSNQVARSSNNPNRPINLPGFPQQ